MRSRVWTLGCGLLGGLALAQLAAACATEDVPADVDIDDGGSEASEDATRDRSKDVGHDDARDAYAADSDVDATVPDGSDVDARDGSDGDGADGGGEDASDAGAPDVVDANDASLDVVDGGSDVDASEGGIKDAALPDAAIGCLDPGSGQIFTASMFGCPGTVFWSDRNTLCQAGCTACPASSWVALDGAIAPTHHYWTDDNLYYLGNAAHECGVTLDGGVCTSNLDGGGSVPSPMRVCVPSDNTSSFDPEGNRCFWNGCAYEALTPDAPNLYFGGCSNGPTAGTLCCCP